MKPVTVEDLFRFSAKHEGVRLITNTRASGFTVRVLQDGLEVTPESSGKPRNLPRQVIERFLHEFERSGIRQKKHYNDITFDASYLLALVSGYLEERRRAQ